MWSASIGLLRSIAEVFGATAGAALVFSASGVLASLVFGLRLRAIPRTYLWLGGTLFVAYEVALALSIGMATSRAQSLELGMINYLWPSLTILLAVLTRQQRASWLLAPALLLCLGGIVLVLKGDGEFSPGLLWQHVQSNPLAYGLATCAAFIWAAYSLVARRYGKGSNAIPLFLLATAAMLWVKYALQPAAPLSGSMHGWLQVAVLGALMAAAYSCWSHGVQRGNLALLAAASYFTPVLSMLLGSAWLGVRPGAAFLQGVAMVTAGSLGCWWATRTRPGA